jgi:hypothetical protein
MCTQDFISLRGLGTVFLSRSRVSFNG